MSLKSLFTITLTSLLFAILLTILVISIKGTQDFIQNQVYSSSQDTVYSLGISIATLDSNSSKDDIELLINAIFDSGYYEYISFYDQNSTLLHEARLPVVVKNVPQWFINIVPIKIEEANGVVNNGWQPMGSLSVKGHMGYAYYELWKTFKKLLVIVFIITVISFALLSLIINTLLFSLKRINDQANAINEHKFIVQNGVYKKFYIILGAI